MELLIKSREAMMSAVQIYNNPQITFKSETFISLSIIAWTYLLHTYYANKGIDYRYFSMEGKKKKFDRTKYGAFKQWELERCLDDKNSPIDSIATQNLKFLIGIRHEIEHQMTKKIDDSISAKIQACSINYNYYIKKLFGKNFGVDHELGLAIQFSPIEAEQKNVMLHNDKMIENVKSFITEFESAMTEDEFGNPHYAYRVVFARVDGKRINGETDEVIQFIPANSPAAKGLNATYTLIQETEKKKYVPTEIVEMMKKKGFSWFTMTSLTNLWKNELKIDRNHTEYGLFIAGSRWMWYENWVPVVEKYCIQNDSFMKSKEK